MCGIVGYIGKKDAVPVLIEGLKRLEYRGYDSAGISTVDKDGIKISAFKNPLTYFVHKYSYFSTPLFSE